MKQRLMLCTTVDSNLGKRKEIGYAVALPISHFLYYILFYLQSSQTISLALHLSHHILYHIFN